MVNRRVLRIKAMQAIYAYIQCRQSNYNAAIDLIGERFFQVFSTEEINENQRTEGKKQLATLLFKENYQANSKVSLTGENNDVAEVANEVLSFYSRQMKRDLDHLKRNMVDEVEVLEENYLYVLLLFLQFQDIAAAEDLEKKHKDNNGLLIPGGAKNLANNFIIQSLKNNTEFQAEVTKRKLNEGSNRQEIKTWYREILKKEEVYMQYLLQDKPDREDDKKIISHIFKNIIFKESAILAFFEEKGFRPEEDKAVIKGMVNKTIKTIAEEDGQQLELVTTAEEWSDEKDFLNGLFSNTLSSDEEYEKLISEKTKNWDVERIAMLDKVILKLATSEMVNFSNIPVKVTINEYLEISKLYSTPKSRKFINGVLDVIAIELTQKGIIKKSGRGLIDNK